MVSDLAPIGVTTYVRLEHLKKTIGALRDNMLAEKSELYVFSDGPKPGDEKLVESVREYIRTIDGFMKVNIIERETNNRIKNSRGGLVRLLEQYGKAIFLPEDIVSAPGFIAYVNMALKEYADNQSVFSVSGYSPPIRVPGNYCNDVFFIRRFNAWGFGIWKDRFDNVRYINPSEYKTFVADSAQVRSFVQGGGEDMLRMLKRDAYGKIDAGDVKAMYAQFLSNQYTVYPVKSLTQNIGFDGSGEHCGNDDRHNVMLWDKKSEFRFPKDVEVDERILIGFLEFRKLSLRARLRHMAMELGIYKSLKWIKNRVSLRSRKP